MAEKFRGTKEEVRQTIVDVMRAVAGHGPDPGNAARGVQLRCGVALLSKIQQAFLRKSRGEPSDDGIVWPPLSRSTIANRRPAPRKTKGQRPRGLLTAKEDARWRKIFAQMVAMLRANGTDESTVMTVAARIAWAKLKSEGAKTKLAVYGGRKVDTLRDTGLLFRSLTPGVDDKPSNAQGQIFETPPGSVIVGTKVKPWHHKGIPGRLPARPLWPDVLPDHWWEAIHQAALRGLMRAVKSALNARSS